MLIRPVLRPTITLANLLRLNLAIKNIHWQITPPEITRRSWHKLYPLIDMFAFYNPKRLFFAATNSSVVKISCSCTTLKPLDHFIIDLARGLFLALRSFKAKYPLHNFAFCVLNFKEQQGRSHDKHACKDAVGYKLIFRVELERRWH